LVIDLFLRRSNELKPLFGLPEFEKILQELAVQSIAYQFIQYEAEEHVFPNDFDRRFSEAVLFIFGRQDEDRAITAQDTQD